MYTRVAVVMLVLGLTLTCAAQDMNSDLVGWWKLDEGTGTTVADASGGGHDGAFAEGTPEWVEGVFGSGLQFDGASELEIADHADFHLEEGLTVCLWAQPESDQPNYGKFFCKQKSGEYPYALQYSSSLQIRATVNASDRFDTPSIPNFAGEWGHLCFTYDGSAVILYRDGEEVTRNAEASGPLAQNDLSLSIGGRLNSGQDYAGIIDDVRLYKRALTAEEVPLTMLVPAANIASAAQPSDGVSDLPRNVILEWTPVASAQSRDVYLGTVLEDVQAATRANPLGVLISQDQDANALDVGALAFGKTYYWRVDEVNGAPDDAVQTGDVWRFTVEPFSYPIETVTATASSAHAEDMGPEKTVDGSGLDAMDQHSTAAEHMWLSSAGSQAWIQYEFGQVYRLHEMWVWNSNQMIEAFVGMGAKDVTIETSLDGDAWVLLEGAPQFSQAPGTASYVANTIVDFGAAVAKLVRITVNEGWGMVPQSSLSEVRFFFIPTNARAPQPAPGAGVDGVDVALTWRAGREAVSHQISLGTDPAAVADGAAVVGTSSEAGFDTGVLDYGTNYFWKVDEINEAGTPTTYAGDVWSFSTPDYGIVDNFDQYDNSCKRIFFAWADGIGHSGGDDIEDCDVPASNGNGGGSIVGNDQAPFAERSIVNAGSTQSMPFNYDNAFGPSEATLSIPNQNWTSSNVQSLSLAFYGTLDNTGQLYIKVNNTKLSYDLDPAAIARPMWQRWNIDLSVFSGLENVTSLSIGVDGANAAGMLYIDDILLYPVAPKAPEQIWLEAENADVLGTSWRSFPDPDSSEGMYIGSENGDGNDSDAVPAPEWLASYSFDVAGGVYKVLLRGQEADSDSFWVRITTATSQTHEDPDQAGTGWVTFNGLDAPDGWRWDEVHSNDHDNEVVHWTLARGTHTLEIGKREDGTLVDAIVITDELD
jgi:hypothetical protein